MFELNKIACIVQLHSSKNTVQWSNMLYDVVQGFSKIISKTIL